MRRNTGSLASAESTRLRQARNAGRGRHAGEPVGQSHDLLRHRPPAAARAGLVASQILGLALCRYVLKLPPVVALKRPALVARVGPTLQAYLLDP